MRCHQEHSGENEEQERGQGQHFRWRRALSSSRETIQNQERKSTHGTGGGLLEAVRAPAVMGEPILKSGSLDDSKSVTVPTLFGKFAAMMRRLIQTRQGCA